MNTDRRISFEDRQRREHLSQEKEAPGIRRRSRSAVNAFLFSVALAAGSWATAGAVDLPPQDRHLPGLPNVDPTSDARRFEMNGRPWAPVGFYGAGMMQVNGEPSWGGNPATAFRAFIDRLEREGLNYHRTWINWGAVYVGNDPSAWDYRQVHPYQRTGPGQAADGNPKFDLTRFDQGYFDLLRDNVDYARDRGVVLQLILFDCWHLEDGNLMDRDYFHQANNVNNTGITTSAQWTDPANQAAKTHLDAFVKKIMETVGDRRNIVWETCNEVRGGSNPAVHGTIRQSIETWDPLDHLIMPGDLPEHRDVAGHWTPGPDNNSNTQSVASMYDELKAQFYDPSSYGSSQFQPLITDNDCCSDIHGDEALRRDKLWSALTAGAFIDFFVDGLPIETGLLNRADLQRGMEQYGLAVKFLRSVGADLRGAEPGPQPYLLQRSGPGGVEEALVYLHNGGSVTVAGLAQPASTHATWLNPSTGAIFAGGTGSSHSAPFAGEAVLHLARRSGGQAPLHGEPWPMPGLIEAEDYDVGGPGVAYTDNSGSNFGDRYRLDSVDVQVSPEETQGHVVAWIQSGEWLEFTVDVGDELVTSTGNWWFEVRASGTSEVRFSLAVDGSSLGSFNFPATGGFNQYQTYSSPGYFTLPRGQHVLRLTATGANFNLNWLRFWEVHKAYVTDVFSNSVAGRSPGDPLNGAPVESGGQVWAASPTVVFGQGEVTNQTGWQHAVATVPFDPASHAGSTAAVLEAEIDPSEVSWIGLGFSKSATGAFWSDGELWAFLRSDGRLHVKAGGLAVSLLDMAAAAPGFQAGTNRLKLSYDWGAGQVRVWLNEVEQTLAPSGLGGYVPQILHAGFHGHRQGGLAIGGLLHLDDFALGLSGPPAAPAGVQASDGTRTDGVQVTWSPASGAEAFRIYRVPEGTAGVGTALSEQVSGTSFLDRTAAPGQRYHYRVQYRLSEGVWSLISTSDLGWRQSFPHGVTSLSPVADAYVTQEMGGSNWGSSQSLRLRHFASGLARYSFLEFDVPVVSGPIRSAVLRLKARNNVVGGVSVFATSDLFWQESQINWNNWTTCSGSTFLRKTWQVQPGAEVFLDVSEAVTATGRVTIALATDFDWGGQDFWSREGSAADRPRLDVTYATSGPQRLVLQPVADAHVVQAQPNDNFGGVDFLRLRTMDFGFGHHAYLKFQVSGVLGGISSATLRMRTQENGLDQVGVYKLPDTSWTELGITWNNAPLQGALPYGQYGPVPASSWFDMPLGSLGTLLPGNGVYTVGMVTGGNVDGLDFWSRDSLCRPTLVLTTSGS